MRRRSILGRPLRIRHELFEQRQLAIGKAAEERVTQIGIMRAGSHDIGEGRVRDVD